MAPLLAATELLHNQPASGSFDKACSAAKPSSRQDAAALSLSQLRSPPSPLPPALPPWTSPDFASARGEPPPDVDLTENSDAGNMSMAIEQEVSALLGDLVAVKARTARADAAAERLRQENGYLQQQVQLEMSSTHRSVMEQQRLQGLLQRMQSELDDYRRREQLKHQDVEAAVPVSAHDVLQQKAVDLFQRSHNFMRWRRMLRLWGACKYHACKYSHFSATALQLCSRRFRRKALAYKASHWKKKAIEKAYHGWKRIAKMCRVFAVVFCQMGLFSARERLGEFFSAWRHQASMDSV
jgi:hypothetical protein